jgi:hypothetical protein
MMAKSTPEKGDDPKKNPAFLKAVRQLLATPPRPRVAKPKRGGSKASAKPRRKTKRA